MHKTNRLLFLALCSGAMFLVVFLSRQGLVVFSTKPFRTFAIQKKVSPLQASTTRSVSSGWPQLTQTRVKDTGQTFQVSEPSKRDRERPAAACVPPHIHPFDPSLSHVLESHPPLSCAGGLPSVVTASRQGDSLRLVVDPTLVNRKLGTELAPACRYRPLFVKPGGDFNTTATAWSDFFTDSVAVGSLEEHFLVACHKSRDSTSPLIAKSYVSVVRERPELEKSLHERLETHVKGNAPKEILNVVVLGIDGMSKQNMIRTLPKTRDFLLGTLKAKEMLNYNKNGMNTFPNVITMLTGKTVAEISSDYAWNTGRFFDNVSFVWDEFARAGYRTHMALDSSRVTSFHCSKRGFSRAPVHYYHRPIVLESEPDSDVRHKDGNCIGDVPEVTLLLDYLLQMAAIFGKQRGTGTPIASEHGMTDAKSNTSGGRRLKKRSIQNGIKTVSTGDDKNNDTGKSKIAVSKIGGKDDNKIKAKYEDKHHLREWKNAKEQFQKQQQRRQHGQQQEQQNKQQQKQQQQPQQQQQQLQQQQPQQQQQQPQQQQQHLQLELRQTDKKQPFFSYNFFVRLTHDNHQKASSGDELYRDFFHSLYSTGALNNSVLIFFSDHGPRFGPLRRTIVGTMEDRMPFCLLALPPWFLRKYPDVDRALTLNQNRLTSHFDIHATLRHILYFDGGGSNPTPNESSPKNESKTSDYAGKAQSLLATDKDASAGPKDNTGLSNKGRLFASGADSNKILRKVRSAVPSDFSQAPPTHRGMSLFREIPRDRSCREAGIDFQWCSCNRLDPVDTEDALVRLLAFEFALLLSDKTLRARHVCHQLNLGKIRSAMRVHLAEGFGVSGEDDEKEEEEEEEEKKTPGSSKPFSKLLNSRGAERANNASSVTLTENDEGGGGGRRYNNTTSASTGKKEEETSMYLLSIETKPGGAVFEGHLQFSHAKGSVRLLGTVLRLNMFQPQSMCVEEPGLKPFCYCKDLDDEERKKVPKS